MNNKGFTLVELLGTIMILSIIIGISSYSIVTVLNETKKKNYELLIEDIKKASETYYQECKYGNNCPYTEEISLGKLVADGYLSSNSKNSIGLTDPVTNKDISNCIISVEYTNGEIKITPEVGDNCPSQGDYE